MKRTVISLYDYTGEAAKPWAIAGYSCVCFDIQHSRVAPITERYQGGGSISYINADLHDRAVLSEIVMAYKDYAAFMMAFPVCTDLAGSGAGHFAAKFDQNLLFQEVAVDHVKWCAKVGDALGCPYFIENPRGKVSTMWRKPDHSFEPWEYGGYIPEDEANHPKWPEYIAPRDAYPKTTYLWTGNGFTMPEKKARSLPAGILCTTQKIGRQIS